MMHENDSDDQNQQADSGGRLCFGYGQELGHCESDNAARSCSRQSTCCHGGSQGCGGGHNGSGCKHSSQRGGGGFGAALRKETTQLFESPLDTHPCRVFCQTEGKADLLKTSAFEKSENHRCAIFFVQFVHHVIKDWSHLLPEIIGGIGIKELVHGKSFLFAALPSVFGASSVSGHAAHTGIKPAGQRRVTGERRGVSGKLGEDCLSDVV